MLVCHINTFEGELFNARASVSVSNPVDIPFRETFAVIFPGGQVVKDFLFALVPG